VSHPTAGSPRRCASNGSGSCRTRCPTLTRENVCANIVSTPSLEIFDDRHPNGTDGFTLLTVRQSQATRPGVRLRPFQANPLATPAAGERNLADDVHDRGVSLLPGGRTEDPTQNSILDL